jgi:hypothetical protein
LPAERLTPTIEQDLVHLRKLQLIAEINNLQRPPAKQNWFVKNMSILTLLLAVIGLPIGVWQYFEKAENDYKKPLWEKQLNYYLEATRATATLAALPNRPDDASQQEWQKARIRFWELYYGELVVLEAPEVSTAMVAFGKCLRDYEDEDNKCDSKTLRSLSLDLAHACRTSVANSWQQPLGKFAERPE